LIAGVQKISIMRPETFMKIIKKNSGIPGEIEATVKIKSFGNT
jgi:hypothetical protein